MQVTSYAPCDIRDVIFNTLIESESDGVIEFYEFVDLLRLVVLYAKYKEAFKFLMGGLLQKNS